MDKLQQAPLLDSSITVGTKVSISGLLSEAGRCLNGHSSDVVCFTEDINRYGVKIGGRERKSIKIENLIPITFDEHFKELMAQHAIDESLLQRGQDVDMNTQLSTALLLDKVRSTGFAAE